MHFDWVNGRQLATVTKGTDSISYTYNADGIRTGKTVNGTFTSFQYANGSLSCQSGGGTILGFFYDENGTPVSMLHFSMQTLALTHYYYVYNLQGDVIALLNVLGNKVVEYEYNPWGELLSVKDANGDPITDATHVGNCNPFRYRGYYYDVETGFYYCGSRYYDPVTCRFISPDTTSVLSATPMGLTDKNLYAYCDNNPVMRSDHGGEFWHIVAGALIGVATKYVSDVATNLIKGESFSEALKPKSTWADYGSAALSGALAATGVGIGASVAGNAVLGGATYLTNCAIKGEDPNFADFVYETGVGALSGVAGGKGASYGNSKTAMSLGKQVTKRVFVKKEVSKAISYYGKNMKNAAGQSIYKELNAGIFKSGVLNFAVNSCRTLAERGR